MKKEEANILKLKAQYAVLAELSGYFPPNSKHEAFKKIDTMMSDILTKLEKTKHETKTINQNYCYNVSTESETRTHYKKYGSF
jgi:hypothetical protein